MDKHEKALIRKSINLETVLENLALYCAENLAEGTVEGTVEVRIPQKAINVFGMKFKPKNSIVLGNYNEYGDGDSTIKFYTSCGITVHLTASDGKDKE